ncbi:hypothetical protein PTKIN_Ptkin17bG0034600 [Pterospermum kingtungense]
MENKEDEGFYHSFSRKELQSLCKKYGLPANRSSSDMAKSLAPYLENQGSGLMTTEERFYGIQEAGLALPLELQLQPEASLNSFRAVEQDCYGRVACPVDRCNGENYSQAVKLNALDCCTGDKIYDKDGIGGGSIFFQQRPESQFVTQFDNSGFKNKEFPTIYSNGNGLSFMGDGRMNNNMPQIEHKDTNGGACSYETAFPSSIKTPTVSTSSFQFYVSSEEGINLYVDLNSKPSEWVEKLKSEVSICQNMSHSKSQTFNELGHSGESSKRMKSSFKLNVDGGIQKDGHIHTGLPPSLIIKENNPLQLDYPNGGDGSLVSTATVPCAKAVGVLEHLEGDQGLTLSKVHPNSQEQTVPADASSAKDGCLITLDSNINSPREKLAADAVLSILDGELNHLKEEHQTSKLENDLCENSTSQNGCNLVSPYGIIHGCLPDGSKQMPMDRHKDAVLSPCENSEFVDLVIPKHNICAEQGGLGGTTELDRETYRNRLPTLVEEQDRSKIISWGESSECLQDKVFENCGGVDSAESHGLVKKRAYMDGDQNDCSVLDSRFLRSTNLNRKVLRRRSMRLVPKLALSTAVNISFQNLIWEVCARQIQSIGFSSRWEFNIARPSIVYIVEKFRNASSTYDVNFLQLLQQRPNPDLVDDEVDDSDLEGNLFVAPLDNPIFDVYDEDDATITTDPVFDEYDDEDEQVFDSYIEEDIKIEDQPIFVLCDKKYPKTTDIVEEKELVRFDILVEKNVICDEIVSEELIFIGNGFIDPFLEELSDGLRIIEFKAMPIIKFCNFHDLTLFCFSNMASNVDHLKGKIRGRILSNLESMMRDEIWSNKYWHLWSKDIWKKTSRF